MEAVRDNARIVTVIHMASSAQHCALFQVVSTLARACLIVFVGEKTFRYGNT